MRILVTGGRGFIGSKFADMAAAAGDIVVYAGRSETGEGRAWRVDLGTGEGLSNVPWHKFDAVVHLAAAGVKAHRRQWNECLQVNTVGTHRLLHAISSAGARPIVWLVQTFYEAEAALFPQLLENPYVATKRAGAELAVEWARRTGATLVFGRLFQAYGPGDDSGNVLSYTLERLRLGEPALLGSGRQRRDWIYLDDVATGIRACLLGASPGITTFELGSGATVALRDVVEQLATRVGTPPALLDFSATRDRADVEIDARATCPPPGWRPQFDLASGLDRLVAARAVPGYSNSKQ